MVAALERKPGVQFSGRRPAQGTDAWDQRGSYTEEGQNAAPGPSKTTNGAAFTAKHPRRHPPLAQQSTPRGECSGCVESNLIYLVKTDTSFVPCVPCSPKKQLRVFIKDHHRTVWCHPTVEEYRGACRRSQRVRFTLQQPPSIDPLNPLQQGLAVLKELKARRQTQTGSTRRGAQARRI